MDGYKLASLAGMLTMGASVMVEYSMPALLQVGQQPAGAIQPGTRVGENTCMFKLREGVEQAKLDQVARDLAEIEKRMETSNEKLMNQLTQARLLDTDKKLETYGEVLAGILQDHEDLHGYLTKMRETMTGKVSEGRLLGTPEEKDKLDELKKDMEDGEDEDAVKPGTDHPPSEPGLPR